MSEYAQSKKNVLYVDDDQDTRDLITTFLGLHDYQVEIAATPTEGLEKAQQNHYNLIILDMYYLSGQGVELCTQIREFDKTTPILFYSAEGREDRIREALDAGAQGFLLKPVDPDHLLQSVKRHTGKLSDN